MLIDVFDMEENIEDEEKENAGSLGFLASPVEDRRLPAPDMMGVLADYQIRKPQLDEIAREVHENWPGVCAVSVGKYSNDHPHFSIEIDPFSKALQREHWPLGDVIRSIIRNENFGCFYLPNMEKTYSSELRIYRREKSEQ